MANDEQVQAKRRSKTIPALVGFVFAVLFSFIFAFAACGMGFLFSGVDLIFTVLVSSFVSGLLTAAGSVVIGEGIKQKGWRTGIVFTIASILALFFVGFLSLVQRHDHLKIFMQPAAIPGEIHVHEGRKFLFSSYMHFTASPADIATVIKVKGLQEVPTEYSETNEMTNFGAAEDTKKSWEWWQPTAMSNPKFYYLHHKSEAVQGWDEGWWVNDKTNEVFAYISG